MIYISFEYECSYADDSWMNDNSTSTMLDSSDDEMDVDNTTTATHTVQVTTDRSVQHFNSDQNLNTVRTVEKSVPTIEELNVLGHVDTEITNYQQTDTQDQTVPVQNVRFSFDPVVKTSFIGMASEEDSYFDDNSDSISYVGRDEEYIDSLNFDDSDISIDEDD